MLVGSFQVTIRPDIDRSLGIMNYDINGQWSTTGVGPNAPLDDACSTVKAGSATSAIAAWTGAKFPAKQLLLGVAAYGHSFTVDPTVAVVSGALASFPAFIKNITTDGVDQCGNPAGADDDLNFVDLVTQGYLTANGTAADGMTYRFDNCSQTVREFCPALVASLMTPCSLTSTMRTPNSWYPMMTPPLSVCLQSN